MNGQVTAGFTGILKRTTSDVNHLDSRRKT